MDIVAKTKKDIKGVKIQGATAVAKSVVSCLRIYAKQLEADDVEEFKKKLKRAANELLLLRPTEPLAKNACKFLFWQISKERDAKKIKNKFIKAADDFLKILGSAREKISVLGARLVSGGDNVFTHCHSSLVESSFVRAKKQGKKFNVFNTETRPLFQGHITARNLLRNKIPVTMVTDSSAEFLISRHSGKNLMMDKVFIGSDAILKNGSCINKIGSFGIGMAAFSEKVPLYIITSLLKFADSSWVEIEKRPAKEVWKGAPNELRIINFAFDIIPKKFISGLVCEAGIIKPNLAKAKVKEIYPWILENKNKNKEYGF